MPIAIGVLLGAVLGAALAVTPLGVQGVFDYFRRRTKGHIQDSVVSIEGFTLTLLSAVGLLVLARLSAQGSTSTLVTTVVGLALGMGAWLTALLWVAGRMAQASGGRPPEPPQFTEADFECLVRRSSTVAITGWGAFLVWVTHQLSLVW